MWTIHPIDLVKRWHTWVWGLFAITTTNNSKQQQQQPQQQLSGWATNRSHSDQDPLAQGGCLYETILEIPSWRAWGSHAPTIMASWRWKAAGWDGQPVRLGDTIAWLEKEITSNNPTWFRAPRGPMRSTDRMPKVKTVKKSITTQAWFNPGFTAATACHIVMAGTLWELNIEGWLGKVNWVLHFCFFWWLKDVESLCATRARAQCLRGAFPQTVFLFFVRCLCGCLRGSLRAVISWHIQN